MNGQRPVLIDAIALDRIKERNKLAISISKKMTDSKVRNYVKRDYASIRQHFRDSPSRHRIIKNPGNDRG